MNDECGARVALVHVCQGRSRDDFEAAGRRSLSYHSAKETESAAKMNTAAIIEGLTRYEGLPVSAIEAARGERSGLISEFLRLIQDYPDADGSAGRERPSLVVIFHLLGEWRETSNA